MHDENARAERGPQPHRLDDFFEDMEKTLVAGRGRPVWGDHLSERRVAHEFPIAECGGESDEIARSGDRAAGGTSNIALGLLPIRDGVAVAVKK